MHPSPQKKDDQVAGVEGLPAGVVEGLPGGVEGLPGGVEGLPARQASAAPKTSGWTSTGKIKRPGLSLSPDQLVEWNKPSSIGFPKNNTARQPGVPPRTEFQCDIIASFKFKVGKNHYPHVITRNEFVNKYHEKVLRILPDLEETMPGLAADCVVIVVVDRNRTGKKSPIVRDIDFVDLLKIESRICTPCNVADAPIDDADDMGIEVWSWSPRPGLQSPVSIQDDFLAYMEDKYDHHKYNWESELTAEIRQTISATYASAIAAMMAEIDEGFQNNKREAASPPSHGNGKRMRPNHDATLSDRISSLTAENQGLKTELARKDAEFNQLQALYAQVQDGLLLAENQDLKTKLADKEEQYSQLRALYAQNLDDLHTAQHQLASMNAGRRFVPFEDALAEEDEESVEEDSSDFVYLRANKTNFDADSRFGEEDVVDYDDPDLYI